MPHYADEASGDEENDEEGEGQETRPVMDTGSDEVLDYPSDCFKEEFYVRFPFMAVSHSTVL